MPVARRAMAVPASGRFLPLLAVAVPATAAILRVAAVCVPGPRIWGSAGDNDRRVWCGGRRQGEGVSGAWCMVHGVWSTSNPSATHAASQRPRPRVGYQDTSVKPDDTVEVRHRLNRR